MGYIQVSLICCQAAYIENVTSFAVMICQHEFPGPTLVSSSQVATKHNYQYVAALLNRYYHYVGMDDDTKLRRALQASQTNIPGGQPSTTLLPIGATAGIFLGADCYGYRVTRSRRGISSSISILQHLNISVAQK